MSVESLDSRPGILIHELTHQFAYDIVPEASLQAPWLIEGLAEHQRGVWDADTVENVRDAVTGSFVPDVDNLAGADRYWSHALFDFIADAHGSEGVRRYLFVLRKTPQPTEALRAALGVSAAELREVEAQEAVQLGISAHLKIIARHGQHFEIVALLAGGVNRITPFVPAQVAVERRPDVE